MLNLMLIRIIIMPMRTTITLDDDIVQKIRERFKESGLSMKQLYNDLLRSALLSPRSTPATPGYKPRVFKGKPGLCSGYSWDMSTAEILNQIDEEEFKA